MRVAHRKSCENTEGSNGDCRRGARLTPIALHIRVWIRGPQDLQVGGGTGLYMTPIF